MTPDSPSKLMRCVLPRRCAALVALAASLLVSCTLLRAAPPTQDPQLHTASPTELGCIKVLLAQERAWNQGDLPGFAKAYKDSPDTLFLSREISRGYAGMLESYRRNYPNRAAMGTLTFSDLEVHPLDEHFAVTIGRYKLERGKKDGGNAEGVFSLVMEKTTEGWKIVVDHTT